MGGHSKAEVYSPEGLLTRKRASLNQSPLQGQKIVDFVVFVKKEPCVARAGGKTEIAEPACKKAQKHSFA